MKWLAIINPRADHHTRAQLQQLETDLRAFGADVAWTNGTHQAEDICRRNAHYDGFIAVGGDGTIAEVVNGLDLDRHRIAFIPAGTGNGLAHDFGMMNEKVALRALRQGIFRDIDLIDVRFRVGRAWRRRLLLSTSALGYVAGATAVAMHPAKQRGAWIHAVAALVQCFRQAEFTARLQLDDKPAQQLTLTNLVVHNTRYIGQFCLFPEAKVADGRLNVLYGRLPSVQQLREDLGILMRTHQFRRSEHHEARTVNVELSSPGRLMIDGDLFGGVEVVRYEVLPRRLKCCVSESFAESNTPCSDGRASDGSGKQHPSEKGRNANYLRL